MLHALVFLTATRPRLTWAPNQPMAVQEEEEEDELEEEEEESEEEEVKEEELEEEEEEEKEDRPMAVLSPRSASRDPIIWDIEGEELCMEIDKKIQRIWHRQGQGSRRRMKYDDIFPCIPFGFHSFLDEKTLNYTWVGALHRIRALSLQRPLPLLFHAGGERGGQPLATWEEERVRQVMGYVEASLCEWRVPEGCQDQWTDKALEPVFDGPLRCLMCPSLQPVSDGMVSVHGMTVDSAGWPRSSLVVPHANGIWVRDCQIVSLPDLMAAHVSMYTAEQIWTWWQGMVVISKRHRSVPAFGGSRGKSKGKAKGKGKDAQLTPPSTPRQPPTPPPPPPRDGEAEASAAGPPTPPPPPPAPPRDPLFEVSRSARRVRSRSRSESSGS